MNIVPIFGFANTYIFPLLLVIVCLINAFDLYKKLLNIFQLK